jgi:hypothetical protein
MPKLSDIWRRRADELRKSSDEKKLIEAEAFDKAAEELERYHGRRLKNRSRYKREKI